MIFGAFLGIVENDILTMSFLSPDFCTLGVGRYGTHTPDTLYMIESSLQAFITLILETDEIILLFVWKGLQANKGATNVYFYPEKNVKRIENNM